MKIYIGEDIWILKEDILGAFTKESLLKSKDGRAFVRAFEEKFALIKINEEVNSFILVKEGEDMTLYESNVSTDSIKNKVKTKGMKSIYE
nr:hypothetical protein [Tissierella sp.]